MAGLRCASPRRCVRHLRPLTDSAGTLVQTYKYDPYGLIRSTTGSLTNPFQFVAQYRHPVGGAGLYRIGARYYSPALGRWTQQDPLDQAVDLRDANRYVYVAADPVNLIDPEGTRRKVAQVSKL